jgi:micrococcal nuclease
LSLSFTPAAFAVESTAVLVQRVIDGDTIEVVYNAKKEHIRLIGVDTPETVHPSKAVQPFGPEASSYTKKALDGREVWLEFDVEPRDRYGRLLAYVWLAPAPAGEATNDNIREDMFNAHLLLHGYGQIATYPPNVRYVEFFRICQTEAREHSHGLWGAEIARESKQPASSPAVASVYIGNRNSKIFHLPNCSSVGKMSEKNRVSIKTREDAIKEGFSPCKTCSP